jgi:hypothetical protein
MAEPTLREHLKAMLDAPVPGALARTNGRGESFTEEELRSPASWAGVLQSHDHLMSVIKRLERRILELEQRPTMEYCGVWEVGETYYVGDFVTDAGSMWACEKANAGVRPGSKADVWTLAVKHGRDGKDRR